MLLSQFQSVPNVKVFHAGTTTSDDNIVTSGGRVLAVMATGATIADARSRAYKATQLISFDGMFYREDIAKKATG